MELKCVFCGDKGRGNHWSCDVTVGEVTVKLHAIMATSKGVCMSCFRESLFLMSSTKEVTDSPAVKLANFAFDIHNSLNKQN